MPKSEPEHCGCVDYEPENPCDPLCYACVCGHVIEEHENGFFRRCIFNKEEAS